jgi:hypothetical protein
MRLNKRVKKQCLGIKTDPGPGKVIPFAYGVDSVVGKLSESSNDTIETTMHATRGHPVEALLISRWLKSFTTSIQGWPFHLVLVNQLGLRKNDVGAIEKVMGGGKQLNFLSSFLWEMKKDGPPIRRKKVHGKQLRITCLKNSLGEDQRSITVDMLWWKKRDTWIDRDGVEVSGIRQHTIFDWDSATVTLLLHLAKDNKALERQIHEVVDLAPVTLAHSQRGIFSKRLGHKKDKDAIPLRAAGQLINQDFQIREGLRDLFGIQRGYIFEPGIDYRDQVDAAMETSVSQEEARTRALLEEDGIADSINQTKEESKGIGLRGPDTEPPTPKPKKPKAKKPKAKPKKTKKPKRKLDGIA